VADASGPDADADRGGVGTVARLARRMTITAGGARLGEHPTDRAIPSAVRLKENLLLVVTALVMCVAYRVRQKGTTPWANEVGAFLGCWLGCYVVLILVLLVVYVLAAVTDKYVLGERGSRILRAAGHQPTIYACLAVLAVSLILLVLR